MKVNILNVIKSHKKLSIGIIIAIIAIIVVTIIMVVTKNDNNVVEEVATDTVVESEDSEDIILDIDTGYNEDEEVAIITEEDGSVIIIPKSDPEYIQKTEGKNITMGIIKDGKVIANTDNKILKDLASKTKEEQIANIKVTESVVSEQVTIADNSTQDQETAKTSAPNTTSATKSPSNTGTTSASKPSASTSANKPSSTSPTTSHTTSKGAMPTGQFIYKHNSSLENQIVSAINTKMQKTIAYGDQTLADWGGKAVNGSSPQGQGFTYRSLQQCQNVCNVEKVYHVYVQDEYCVYTDGSQTKTSNTLVYIY